MVIHRFDQVTDSYKGGVSLMFYTYAFRSKLTIMVNSCFIQYLLFDTGTWQYSY